MNKDVAGMRAEARKCRDLASSACVPSSKEWLLRIAREFEQMADEVEDVRIDGAQRRDGNWP